MKRAWKIGWRVLVCIVLLGWIFHAIFLNEAKAAARQRGINWESLPRAEQWSQAWTVGPHELWAQVTLIHKGALALSVVLMAMTIVLGVVRWRMVLRVHGLDCRGAAQGRFRSSHISSIRSCSDQPAAIS